MVVTEGFSTHISYTHHYYYYYYYYYYYNKPGAN